MVWPFTTSPIRDGTPGENENQQAYKRHQLFAIVRKTPHTPSPEDIIVRLGLALTLSDAPTHDVLYTPKTSRVPVLTSAQLSALRRGLSERWCIRKADWFGEVDEKCGIKVSADKSVIADNNGSLYWRPQPLDDRTKRYHDNNLLYNFDHVYFASNGSHELPAFFFQLHKDEPVPKNVVKRPTVLSVKATDNSEFVRSTAPSPEEGPVIPLKPADTVVHHPVLKPIETATKQKTEWIPFNVREFEDTNAPLMFLDSYTQKSNGWPMIRSAAMIPERFIERMSYKTACLDHGEDVKGADKEEVAKPIGVDSMKPDMLKKQASDVVIEIDDDDEDEDDATDPGVDTEVETMSNGTSDWENDPNYQYFCRRLEQQKHLRHHRLHPVSRYFNNEADCDNCQATMDDLPLGVEMPDKITEPTDEEWKSLKVRYQALLNKLDVEDILDNRSCPICYQTFKHMMYETSPSAHMMIHRNNHTQAARANSMLVGSMWDMHMSDSKPLEKIGLESMHLGKGAVPDNHEFYFLEQLCNLAENEILQREEYCRVCHETFVYGDMKLIEHYRQHADAEDLLVERLEETANVIRSPASSPLSDRSYSEYQSFEEFDSSDNGPSPIRLPGPPFLSVAPFADPVVDTIAERLEMAETPLGVRQQLARSGTRGPSVHWVDDESSMPSIQRASAKTLRPSSPRWSSTASRRATKSAASRKQRQRSGEKVAAEFRFKTSPRSVKRAKGVQKDKQRVEVRVGKAGGSKKRNADGDSAYDNSAPSPVPSSPEPSPLLPKGPKKKACDGLYKPRKGECDDTTPPPTPSASKGKKAKTSKQGKKDLFKVGKKGSLNNGKKGSLDNGKKSLLKLATD